MFPQILFRNHELEYLLHDCVLHSVDREYPELAKHMNFFFYFPLFFLAYCPNVVFSMQGCKSGQFCANYSGLSSLWLKQGKFAKTFAFAKSCNLTKNLHIYLGFFGWTHSLVNCLDCFVNLTLLLAYRSSKFLHGVFRIDFSFLIDWYVGELKFSLDEILNMTTVFKFRPMYVIEVLSQISKETNR